LLSTDVRLNRSTGFILERDALAIESGNDSKLKAGLIDTGQASAEQTILARDDDLNTTKELTVTVAIVALGYIKIVSPTMTFRRSLPAAA
jgi:hypothetical protein